MGELALGFAGALIPIVVIVGVIVIIVRTASGQGRSGQESGGVHVRRFFVCALMLAMLVLVGVGIAGLIDAALPSTGLVLDGSAAAARSIAFVLVAGPVYAGLWWYTLRRLRSDPLERQSAAWAFYLIVALIGSLVATMGTLGAVLSEVVSGDSPDRSLIIHAVIWATAWFAHWQVSKRYQSDRGTQIHLLLGSAVGLWWSFAGLVATIGVLLTKVYDSLFLTVVSDGGIENLLRPTMVLVVGAPVWWWYWMRHAAASHRSRLWLAYVLLGGVLTGLVASISGAGIVLNAVLEWFIGDVSGSAARHFDVVPTAVAALVTGVGAWVYHAQVLGDRDSRERTEVDRVYGYLVSGAGLVVAASGIATLIAGTLTTIGGRGNTAIESGDTVAVALTLLLIGTPLWWRYWSGIQRYRRSGDDEELASITRRIYLVALFGVSGIVAVVSLIVIVFIFVEDLLDGTLGKESIESAAVAISLVATTAGVAWYHFAVFREDRADLAEHEPEEEAKEEVDHPNRVRFGDLEHTLRAMAVEGGSKVMVSVTDDGFVIEPMGEGGSDGSEGIDRGIRA